MNTSEVVNTPRILNIYVCLRCGWKWSSRLPHLPRCCAGCHSSAWQHEKPAQPYRMRLVTTYASKLRPLQVGDSLLLPWHARPNGVRDEPRNSSMYRSVAAFARRAGVRLRIMPGGAGLKVTRIS